jgi:fumarylpyruvate hydrolase
VAGSADLFPVNRIHCVGRNYAAHAIEMGSDPEREPPFFFQKPADALVANHANIPYPAKTDNLHYEVELVVAIGKPGHNIPVEEAPGYIWGYGVGVDLTRRDLQKHFRELQRPWEPGKAFDNSAPMSEIVPVDAVGLLDRGEIELRVNNEVKQSSNIDQLIWSIPEIIAILSEYWLLHPGDLIFTGTPSGVGPLKAGDQVAARVEGLPSLQFEIC